MKEQRQIEGSTYLFYFFLIIEVTEKFLQAWGGSERRLRKD